ncbi:beta-galactosidase [Krasilnikoviella flava]|uniref:Beta-galactosidase n=1 Tax=Krasilnikoviella flava TaxID=526729 RepID=A0A1T5LZ25_9MICO|nr:beta-galactosidase [Krasilnikoviella flava]SKC81212.1 beta-galactosidase [Krasilnikoviella flava]
MTAGLARLTDELGILYGGDYNPEQWDPAVWREDVALMQEAGVNLVTVGVFSWSREEPRPGEYDFAWLDEVLDLLHDAGIAVDLATPVASPPPWLGHQHPESLPTTADGTVLSYGSRNQFCPSSDAYRDAAARIAEQVASRYSGHPAVRMWHAGNEYGQACFCDRCAERFRDWLRARYGTLDTLNEAWATTVWSQGYGDWAEILPPRVAPYHHNPSQELDFRRFGSDLLLDLYREQKAIVRRHDPDRPVTTNLMGFFGGIDPHGWRADLDVIADDAYPDPASPDAPADAALVNHLARGLGGGSSWLRMEQAASAVSWREHNLTKSPGRLRTEVLQALAHGCDGALFFQWRQARSGPERFHSAMLPVAGPGTAVHEGVRRLGAELRDLGEVVGQRVHSRVALLWDWPSWWAATQVALPTARLDPLATLQAWHRELWRLGVVADVVDARSDDVVLHGYNLVLAPALSVLDEPTAARLDAFVTGGGRLVWGPFGGVADDLAHLHLGRSPALLRHVLGVSAEEWVPLPDGGSTVVWSGSGSSSAAGEWRATATTLGERTRSDGADVIATYDDGPLDGCVAVARHEHGAGHAWYVGADLAGAGLDRVLRAALDDAGVPHGAQDPDVETVWRGRALVAINHADRPATLDLAAALVAGPADVRGVAALTDVRTGARHDLAPLPLAPHDVVVLAAR